MKLFHNLQTRILVFILSTVMLILVSIGFFVGVRNHNFAVDRAKEYTQLMADNNSQKVGGFFKEFKGIVVANTENLASQLSIQKLTSEQIASLLEIQLKKHPQFESVWFILDAETIEGNQQFNSWAKYELNKRKQGEVLFKTNSKGAGFFEHQLSNNEGVSLTEPYKSGGFYVSDISAPIYVDGNLKGFVGITLNLAFLTDYVQKAEIFEGGFITVMTSTSQFVAHANTELVGKPFGQNFPQDENDWNVENKVSKAKSFDITTHFQRATYYSYFVPMQVDDSPKRWMIEVTVPMHKILESSKTSIRNSVVFALFGVIIMIIVIFQVTRRIIGPIRKVTNILDLLAVGNTHAISEQEIKGKGELQQMNESLNKVVKGLRITEQFALEIGKGNLNADFEVLGSEDRLGKALLSMRESLLHSVEEEKKRKEEEELRSWATQGVAKFGEILRQDSSDMKKLGFNFISNLVNYLDVNQGAMFVLNDEMEEDNFFELSTAIAYGRDKFLKKEIRLGEGLVGRCAYEKKTIFLTEVPEDYVKITSGLGTANPTCVLIVPCILNDEVYGVIEIASFRTLKPYEIEFVEKLGESLASTISNVKVNEKTNRLLAASQNQSEELAAQEEELRQNLEEMEATQEDLKRQMETNAKMREEMKNQAALLDALLNSLPDYIYFKDKESRFLKISKSMLGLFGAKTVEEVIGKTDFDYHTPENAQKYFDDEQNIIRTKQGITDQLQREVTHDGEIVWTTATKLPLITDQGECIGTFGISKNVTALKNLEIEKQRKNEEMLKHLEAMEVTQSNLEKQNELNAKMRESLMQQTTLLDALLNYLPDYIYFKDKDSKFIRISKSMTSLFGAKSVDEVIGKSDFDFQTPENAKKYYDDEQLIIKSRKGITNQLQREKMPDGTLLWNSVTKLPLLTDDGKCVGTFGISKDVTALKNLEEETHQREVELNGILNAVKKSTYTVEYDANGIITDANEALLELFGLTRDEIVGTHHQDGIDMQGVAKKEYEAFWNDLNKGKIKKLRNRLEINDKVVWLSETYTPIKDTEGKVVKVLKIAFDITEFQNNQKK